MKQSNHSVHTGATNVVAFSNTPKVVADEYIEWINAMNEICEKGSSKALKLNLEIIHTSQSESVRPTMPHHDPSPVHVFLTVVFKIVKSYG